MLRLYGCYVIFKIKEKLNYNILLILNNLKYEKSSKP